MAYCNAFLPSFLPCLLASLLACLLPSWPAAWLPCLLACLLAIVEHQTGNKHSPKKWNNNSPQNMVPIANQAMTWCTCKHANVHYAVQARTMPAPINIPQVCACPNQTPHDPKGLRDILLCASVSWKKRAWLGSGKSPVRWSRSQTHG